MLPALSVSDRLTMANSMPSGLPETGDERVDIARKRLHEQSNARFSIIEDAMVVQAHLEKKQTELLNQHTSWLSEHDRMMQLGAQLMLEIEGKLNALIDIVDRGTSR